MNYLVYFDFVVEKMLEKISSWTSIRYGKFSDRKLEIVKNVETEKDQEENGKDNKAVQQSVEVL